MFNEITKELLSMIDPNPLEKVAHLPTRNIARAVSLCMKIDVENIERVYQEKIGNMNRVVVTYVDESKKDKIMNDELVINGCPTVMTLYPSYLLDSSENNIVPFIRTTISYISDRIFILESVTKNSMPNYSSNKSIDLLFVQSIPILVCDVIRQVYRGDNLPKIVYLGLVELLPSYKKIITEDGINEIFRLLDDVSVELLLDDSIITCIDPQDKNYPWRTDNE